MFGALGVAPRGTEAVHRNFRELATRFANGSDLRFEPIAAGVSGDLAYSVGYETSRVSLDAGPVGPSRIRVTHVYRRENGEWKLVHRHGDRPPPTGQRLDQPENQADESALGPRARGQRKPSKPVRRSFALNGPMPFELGFDPSSSSLAERHGLVHPAHDPR